MSENVGGIGSIGLDLVINTNNLKQQFSSMVGDAKKQLSAPVEELGKSISVGLSKPFESTAEKLKTDSKKIVQEVKQANDEMKRMARESTKGATAKLPEGFDYDPSTVEAQINSICEEMDKARDKAKAAAQSISDEIRRSLGNFEFSEDPTEMLQKKLENTKEKISLLQRKWQELTYALGNEETDEGAAKIVSQLNTVERSLLTLQASAEQTQAKIDASLGASAQQPTEAIKNRFSKIKEAASSVASSIRSKLGGAFNKLKSVGGKAVNGLKNHFKKLKGSVNGMNNPLKKLGKSIKSAMKSAFLMAALYAAFRGIKKALSDACNGNEEFAKSLNEVKANLNIAFQPVMTAIMPAINSLMSGLAKATQTIAAFTSELFGSTYQKSLESVKQMKAVSKQAANTSKYLAGFDVMNVAGSDNSSESSEEDGGVDYSAINGEGVTLPDWASRLKDSLKSGDWAGVGSLFAEKINSAFDIDWKSVKKKVNSAVSGLVSGLNSFVKDFDWKCLGKTIAEGMNTAWGAAHTFVTTFDFKKLGTSVSDSINEYVAKLDTNKIGQTISGAIKGLLDLISSFLQNIDWQQLVYKVGEFIAGVDWSGMVSSLAEAIGSALGGLASLLGTAISSAVHGIRDYFTEKIQECGGNIIEGLWNGIKDAFVNVGTWIKDNIFSPFIKGFKKAFGINSPSKVMKEMAGFIMDGLLGGITSKVKTVIEAFKGLLKDIKNVFTGIPSWFKQKFTEALNNIKNAFSVSKILMVFSTVKATITKVFTSIPDWFKEKFSKAWENVKNVFSKGGQIFSGIKEGIADTFKTIVNKLISGINTVIAFPFDKINSMLNKIRGIDILGVEPFKKLWDKNPLPVPQIPALASGGLATAPTLAMVGDNSNARIDPEVIAPLSKLQKLMSGGGDNAEIISLLKHIIELLERMQFVFNGEINEGVLFRAIVRLNREYKERTGMSAI